MTPEKFRELALSFPEVVESFHMSHPDFRIQGRIFATLGAPGPEWGMIKLTPEQQQAMFAISKETFVPASGAWGRSGCTLVRLKLATTAIVRSGLEIAVNNLLESSKPKKKAPGQGTGDKPVPRRRGKGTSGRK